MISDAGGSNVNWYGRWAPSRYTNIGGAVGCAYENSTISQCIADGTMEMKRVGTQAESYEFALGGIIGKVDSGTVDNCASTVTMTIKEGFGGTIGGIAGLIKLNGKVSNVVYYGQIVTESFSGGWFGGLAGSVEGVLTKGYFHGKILSDSTQKADIAANISTTGSASKVIGNGNTRLIYGANSGSVSYAYIIDLDYGSELLQNAKLLFEDLCLFETDIWAVDDETGLYLIAFPENALGGEAE